MLSGCNNNTDETIPENNNKIAHENNLIVE
jgi:hypothetical protein